MTARKVTVKPSEGRYKWSQTPETITISLPVKNVLLKNVEVLYSDLCLKVNAPKINYVEVIDFPAEVEFDSSLNKVQLTDVSLEIFLIKKVPD
jgi:hypothetical protein